jgi:hypothetical protein
VIDTFLEPYSLRGSCTKRTQERNGTQLNSEHETVCGKKKGNKMNFDPGQLNQLLSQIPYPIGKAQLVQFVQQHGANDQIMGLLEHLPDKTFNSQQEVQDALGGLGNLGDLGGFKL